MMNVPSSSLFIAAIDKPSMTSVHHSLISVMCSPLETPRKRHKPIGYCDQIETAQWTSFRWKCLVLWLLEHGFLDAWQGTSTWLSPSWGGLALWTAEAVCSRARPCTPVLNCLLGGNRTPSLHHSCLALLNISILVLLIKWRSSWTPKTWV